MKSLFQIAGLCVALTFLNVGCLPIRSATPATRAIAQNSKLSLDTGLLESESMTPNFHILFPFSKEDSANCKIGNGVFNFLYYPSGSSSVMELHDGVDLRVPAGTKILAPVSGFVALREQGKYHSVLTLDETDERGIRVGRVWGFSHIDFKNIPEKIKQAAAQQSVVGRGEHIAEVVKWIENEVGMPDQNSVFDGMRYDHVHVNVKYGRGRFLNLSRYFAYADATKPDVKNIYFVRSGLNAVVARDAGVVDGKVDIVVEATDTVDGSPFLLTGVTQGSVEIENSNGKTIYKREIALNRELGEVNNLYLDSVILDKQTIVAQGDQFLRRSFFVFTRLLEGDVTGKSNKGGLWDSRAVANAQYKLIVKVGDSYDNFVTKILNFVVKN